MNKTILLGIFAIILCSINTLAYNENITINRSELPYEFNTSIDMNFIVNETVFIERLDNNLFINVDYPINRTFENSTERLYFNYTINEIYISENTSYNIYFKINNSANNITTNYSILLNLIADDSTLNTTIIDAEIIDSSNGTRAYRLTTNVLPMLKQINYKIRGLAGETLFIDCFDADVLTCPTFKIFDSNNMTDFNVEALIPYDYSLGIHEYKIQFRTNDTIIERKIIFEIIEAEIGFKDYVFDDSCFKKVDGEDELAITLDCINNQTEFLIRQSQEYIEKIRTGLDKADYCADYIQIEEKMVVVGNVSGDLYDELQTCRNKKNEFETDYTNILSQFNECSEELTKNNTDISLRSLELVRESSETFANKFEELQNDYDDLKQKEENLKKERRNSYIFGGFVFVSLLVCFYAYNIKKGEINYD